MEREYNIEEINNMSNGVLPDDILEEFCWFDGCLLDKKEMTVLVRSSFHFQSWYIKKLIYVWILEPICLPILNFLNRFLNNK